jgi:hypothetical protein
MSERVTKRLLDARNAYLEIKQQTATPTSEKSATNFDLRI